MDNGIIGQRINKALAFRNVKRKELAKELGVKDNVVSYWCSGTRTPNVQQIIQISKILNVSADYLTGISEAKTNDIEVKDNVVSYWCSGTRTPNVQQIIQISKILNVSADYLTGISEAKTNDIELKAICDYTGLTEDIINTLHTQKGKIKRVLLCENMVVLEREKTNRNTIIKAICDYTGLTEDIINTLHTQKGKIKRVLLCENMVVLEREKTNRNTIKKYLFEVK